MEKISKLSNGLTIVYKKNPQTPRIALNLFIKSGVIDEEKAGETSLITKLLLQGTKNLSSKELADKIDFYGIDLITDVKQDYLKVKAVFLNDDVEIALDLLSDIILNSTFDNFEKEVNKLKGEIVSDLDSAKTKALDNLIKNLYENHPYGNSYTKILEEINNITKEDVKNLYYSKLTANNCVISIVGDLEEAKIISLLEKHFAQIKNDETQSVNKEITEIKESKTVTIEKEDVAQAQIFKSWILPGLNNKDMPVFMVLNSILGSCGLSSRLFLELREKRGLAYVVRSSLDVMNLSSTFTLYIASEPKNIKTALAGFKTEVDKLKAELVSEKELQSAKNNIIGKRAFLHETNSQQSHYLGYYELLGLGAAFDEKLNDEILKVTPEDIKRVTNEYLKENYVVSLLAPKEFLN
ncbi:MAG: insulinase family protein [Candidatus Gastranaerophilales bacterium]|nr:insulinase family protein [Candidatus Gastranaerophilales bacterium]